MQLWDRMATLVSHFGTNEVVNAMSKLSTAPHKLIAGFLRCSIARMVRTQATITYDAYQLQIYYLDPRRV